MVVSTGRRTTTPKSTRSYVWRLGGSTRSWLSTIPRPGLLTRYGSSVLSAATYLCFKPKRQGQILGVASGPYRPSPTFVAANLTILKRFGPRVDRFGLLSLDVLDDRIGT